MITKSLTLSKTLITKNTNSIVMVILTIVTVLASINVYSQKASNFIFLDKSFLGTTFMEEDHLGYMWMTSSRGIYKFNGYNFSLIPYTEIFGDDYTFDRDYILKKDAFSNFWICTYKGELTRVDSTGNYTSYKDKLPLNQKSFHINTILPHKNQVWFGSSTGTLLKYDYNTSTLDSITSLPKIKNRTQSIKSIVFTKPNTMWISSDSGYITALNTDLNTITRLELPKMYDIKLTSDKLGRLWIATETSGLMRYDPASKEIKQYSKIDNLNTERKYDLFISVFCDSSGIIWAGTDGDGLYQVNPITEEILVYKNEKANKFSISDNTITGINEDSHGNIWLGTKKGHINVLPSNTNGIKYYSGLENNGHALALSILKSSDNGLWIGTDGNGLTKIFPDGKKIFYNKNQKGTHYFEGAFIQSLIEDSKGDIWVATYKNGLWVFNNKSKSFEKVKTPNTLEKRSTNVGFLFKDSKNRIWASFTNAIYLFSEEKEVLLTYSYADNDLLGFFSNGICQDKNGTIWISVGEKGLFEFNENPKDLNKSYLTKKKTFLVNEQTTRNYGIWSLTPDYNGNLWIISNTGFLIRYSIQDDSYESFLNYENFKNIRIRAILIDDNKNLWFSSLNNGIHHYEIDKKTLTSFFSNDGLQVKKFRRRSAFKDSHGMFYFGGEEGVNAFYPDQMKKHETNAKLYINAIEVLNKPANQIISDQLKGRIEQVKKLQFKANQSSFSFQFSAIDNILNANYHYAYRLKGFDSDWIIPKKERIATYTNIPSGSYTFEVKGGSKKTTWDIAPIQLDIKIKSFWWRTYLAYFAYLILLSFIIYSIIIRVRLKNKLIKETTHSEKEKEIYALKMNFFAKMSHEIQTPLTLILGPISDMLERAGANKNDLLKQRLLMIKNNANRLSRLAMELMTVRNKELNKLRIYASKNNLIEDLKRISLSFKEQARFKNIDFIQAYPQEEINVWYDVDKIEHIIYNLLSNAFKFTPKGGKIALKVVLNKTDEIVDISVSDTGPGIPKEELDDIFKLFYQSDLGKHTKGTGIGLALANELISLHKGEIKVASSPEKGTCFSVILSTKETLFSEDQKVFVEDSKPISNSTEEDFKALEKELNLNNNLSKKAHTLLIVEDNIEMQMFLRDVLYPNYNLLIANNGKEGVSLATKNNPDLIISDIMMPEMDGFEMCKILQKKKTTSHIPIILLTAKNDKSSKLKGLKSGAIEYIQKPFQFYELALKINNIISTKENIISKYKTDVISSPENILEVSKDEAFMEDLFKELHDQVDNSEFKLEDLSKTLNMSYSVIYKKCHDITGMSLLDYFRSIRIKKAALLIIKNGYNISEASFIVGYKNPKYFRKCFKEVFGITPALLKREAKKIGEQELIEKYKISL